MRHFSRVNSAWISFLVLIILPHLVVTLVAAQQPITHSQDIQLGVGDSLLVTSNRTSIERIVVVGNLSYASIKKPVQYPADQFAISSETAATYVIELSFNYSSDYVINLSVNGMNGSLASNNTTYYVSGGSFNLDVKATFNLRTNVTTIAMPPVSPWQGFVNWFEKFGQAFPTWVKLIYLTFGVQFFAVGGLWIRRETARKETGAQRLDAGEKAFLWVDVAHKFLLFSFLAIVIIMGGEVLVLSVLRFMLLVSLNLLSLWDLFVVGFAAGVIIIAYLIRLTLEKAFDLKPMGEE
jgi:hypothetical protein